MYEKHGLMIKVSDPVVLEYLRTRDGSCTNLVEYALRKKIGWSVNAIRWSKVKKHPDCRNTRPVKVCNKRLIDYIIDRKKNFGISHKFTLEDAVRSLVKAEK